MFKFTFPLVVQLEVMEVAQPGFKPCIGYMVIIL